MGFILLLLNAILSNSKVNEFERVFGYFNVNIFQPGDVIKITGNDANGKLDSYEILYTLKNDSITASNVVIKDVNATDIVTDNNKKTGSIKKETFDFESGSLVLNGLKIAIEEILFEESGYISYKGLVSINNAKEQKVIIKFISGNLSATSDKNELEEFEKYNLYIEECDYERTDMLNGKYKYDITNATGNLYRKKFIGVRIADDNVNASFLGDNVTLEIYDTEENKIDDEIYVNGNVKIDSSEIVVYDFNMIKFTDASFTLIVEADGDKFKSVEITTDYKFIIRGHIEMAVTKALDINIKETKAINIPLRKYPLISRFGFWYQNVRFIKFTPENLEKFDLQASNILELTFDMSDVKKINPQANIFSIFFSENASPLITSKILLDKMILTFPPGTMNTDILINIVYNDKVTASYFKFNQAGNFYDATFLSKMFVGGVYSTVIRNPPEGTLYFKNNVDVSLANQSLLNIQNLVQSKKVKKQISEADFDFIKTRTAFMANSEKFSNQITRRLRNGRINNDFRNVLDEYEATVNITLDLLKNGAREFPTEVIANQINC